MAAAASTSMAATAVLMHRLPATKHAVVFSPLPTRPSLSPISLKQLKDRLLQQDKAFSLDPFKFITQEVCSAPGKASSSEDTPIDANELFTDLKEKWDAVENKSTVLIYGGGAVVAVWLASVVVGAINSVPLLPKIMELVGLGYTGWFVYRYLLFKSSRKELATDIEAIKKKITGTE
ncbi:UNVERIFIED_CONTAM: protein CURVATURE THYLAKOID 1A, chloroplastic [Sesamum angustifolium]|uniref:Protein CURVATURE THYLAKOID 1A, chloroplastic n=1 Tax=Sesamum angustifolium TaxID=2727405 RepID=A0AAW2N8I5_9LAMI